MKGTSLYNLYQGKMSEQNIQTAYNISAFKGSYRANNASERAAEQLHYNIECGLTTCRLCNESETIPNNIERCR